MTRSAPACGVTYLKGSLTVKLASLLELITPFDDANRATLGRPPAPITRRAFLQAIPLAVAPTVGDHGKVRPPRPVPDVPLVSNSGAATSLPALVADRATAVQLMFTQCTTTCPIQAAIFERVQQLVPGMQAKGIQLLSISVDPQADTPKALTRWLHRFHAGPGWIAAAPSVEDGPRLQSFFGAPGSGFAGHSTQVNILDRQGRLVWRTVELPTAEEIASVLQKI
jgi:protein SCO1/2